MPRKDAAPTNHRIRVETAHRILRAFGLASTKWTTIDELVARSDWLVEHEQELQDVLPGYVIGNLTPLNNRALVGFIRRVSALAEAAILTKRLGQQRVRGKCKNIYAYKAIVNRE